MKTVKESVESNYICVVNDLVGPLKYFIDVKVSKQKVTLRV